MTQSKFIADRLREVLLNGLWIANTNYKAQIEDVNWKEATKQVHDLNTVALLVFHIDYYLGGLIDAMEGRGLTIRDKYSLDMPMIKEENDWLALVEKFTQNARRFADLVEALDDSQLDRPFVDEKYGSYRRNIEGVIEHSYYHLGQISLIKKMVKQKRL